MSETALSARTNETAIRAHAQASGQQIQLDIYQQL